MKAVSDPTDQCGSCGKPASTEVRTSTYPQLIHSMKYCQLCTITLWHLLSGVVSP